MDIQRFDALTSTVARSRSRRSTFRLVGGAVLGAGGLGLLRADAGQARRKKKRRGGSGTGGGNGGQLRSGAPCETDAQCRNQLICEVPQNAANSDTECCGAAGATCGGVNDDGDFLEPYCCIGEAGVRAFVCSESDPSNPFVRGTCLPAPRTTSRRLASPLRHRRWEVPPPVMRVGSPAPGIAPGAGLV